MTDPPSRNTGGTPSGDASSGGATSGGVPDRGVPSGGVPDRGPFGAGTPLTRVWRNGRLAGEGFPVAEMSERLSDPAAVVWVDLVTPDGPGLRLVAEELGLDPVAVEDAISSQERAKLDRYHGYLFLNVYSPEITGGELVLHEVSAFVTDRALVTVRQDAGFDAGALIRRWDEGPDAPDGPDGPDGPAAGGAALLLYGLLDLVVDRQLDAVQTLDDEADRLEELIFDETFPVREIQRRSFLLRKNLVTLRRVALPMREIVNTLLRRPSRIVPEPLIPYFQDVYDHTLRVGEWTDGLRDLIANLLDTRIALQGNRLNEVMKKVTSWAAIIAVPTAVTGFYGQNVPYPGFGHASGFAASTVIVIACSVGLYITFKIKDWL
ncbi:magnesium transporter CorA family protein [Actinomadura viridis]|uniref:magnesium transporter CorA family protein n=1 Tax=Actinomadura viridis TaxID=58110 RepID=UPI0036C5BE33